MAELQISNKEQLERWVKGDSIHRSIKGIKGGECCPDFSCCKQELLAPERLRKEFLENKESRRKLLMGFLGQLLSNAKDKSLQGKKIYLTDGEHR